MYLNKELGMGEQRMLLTPKNEDKTMTALDKINELLDRDTDNLYHVVRLIENSKWVYHITILGIGFIKTFEDKTQYYLEFGEDGVWENRRDKEEDGWDDGSYGELEIVK
jgi:hypothetical protein